MSMSEAFSIPSIIKLYYTKALSNQASSLAPDWILLLWRPRIPGSFRGSATTFHRKGTWRDISPKKTYRWLMNTWKFAQRCSLLEKCKSKTQWDITSHWSEWLSSKSLQTINAGEDVENPHCWWESKLVQPLWRTVLRFHKKTRNETTIWSSNPTTGHIPWEKHKWKRHMYPNLHCSTIYNS